MQRRLNRLLFVLVGLTLLLLAWNQFGMESSMVVDASSPYRVDAVDDRGEGGASVARLRREANANVLDCEIRQGYAWPYCEITFTLSKEPAGVDLSRYDRVRLWLRAEGPEPQQQLRFFLRQFNAAYSKAGDPNSMKVQEIVYDPSHSPAPLEVRLSQFAVASWWATEHLLPVQLAGPEFDNVVAIDVSTGGNVVPGTHRIVVERIEFGGKLISTANFRLGVIAAWMALALGYLVQQTLQARRALRATRRSLSSLKRINEALQVQSASFAKLAQHDPLTGLLNRKGLGDELLRLGEARDDQVFPMSVALLDVDHFKQVNDQHGHAVGDQVLQLAANLIKDGIQRRDLVARWGGEEFVLLFPATPAAEAMLIAERLRMAMAAQEWPRGLRMTASFGVAEWSAGGELADAIDRADEAMYRAKQLGRNRVEREAPGPARATPAEAETTP
jgi:diguanylate cyclase (GGDEF)-like protein